MQKRDPLTNFAIATVFAAWTVIAAYLVLAGFFGATDTSCDGGTPRVEMEGGWLVIVTVAVWVSPVIIYAAIRRSRESMIAAAIVGTIAAAIIVRLFAAPGEFCF